MVTDSVRPLLVSVTVIVPVGELLPQVGAVTRASVPDGAIEPLKPPVAETLKLSAGWAPPIPTTLVPPHGMVLGANSVHVFVGSK